MEERSKDERKKKEKWKGGREMEERSKDERKKKEKWKGRREMEERKKEWKGGEEDLISHRKRLIMKTVTAS
ncbi:hypothetical protein Pmani_035031 [Petrolisthes manimaculis]|uniref:Uncharacterized protein n=1 Tax=Petrolisthes manimaculis TaxID=1843537 RepID=A0AAE1NMI5_9EUCA|nr:hypothetical protein Pmani_035031 [Petrolisthes manimaculis]